MDDPARHGWPLAYALAWLSVAGGNSVMPPWVRHQFPEAGRLVRRLRDTACADPGCDWCREMHDAEKELARWFGFPGFRPEPADDDGRPLQQSISEAAMMGEHVLGILPTGAGKSVCYQVPALSRYDKTGALTVVISPLLALMADQVAGLEAQGIGSCVTVNSLLSMPERADALDRVRLGDAAILLISPEQLRSVSLRRVLAQREIGSWVLDEAHCLSRWGHDFRPDYRYVGRFIRERAGDEPVPPVLCLTATAKPDVKAALDGLYVLRTNVDEEQLDTAGVVLAYKSLAHVEQAFRHFKLSDLEVRPIYHYTEPRVRAYLLLCMLAYWVQREMQRALAPLLFVDEAPPARPDPVAPAPRSETVLEKYRTQRTADGFPVHSFRTLLADLGTMVKNRVILTGVPEAPGFDQVTVPTQLQARALELLQLPINPL